MIVVLVPYVSIDNATGDNHIVFVGDVGSLGFYGVTIEGVMSFVCHAASKVAKTAVTIIDSLEIVVNMQGVIVADTLFCIDLPITCELFAYPAFELFGHIFARDAALLDTSGDELACLHLEDSSALYILVTYGLGVSVGTYTIETVKA